jgi:hypothetical protein
MKDFNELLKEYEWQQERLPGGPGYEDDEPEPEEPDWEEIIERKKKW